MIECGESGVEFLRFAGLAEQPELSHAVFTRRGGVSAPPFDTLNASSATGDAVDAVRENKRRMARVLALDLVSVMPVHGADVAAIEPPGAEPEAWRDALRGVEADAMMTDVPGMALFWAFGDCMPILLYDPRRRAVALVHAGWRGTAKGVALRAVAALQARYGTHPEDLLAGMAPSIGKCCYTLTAADREQFRGDPFIWEHTPFERSRRPDLASPERIYAVDLWASNHAQLLHAGLRPEHIEASDLCTGCHTDRFYSNRIERGGTGRFGVGIGLRARPERSPERSEAAGAPLEAWA